MDNSLLDGMYREVILDHYKNPRGNRPLEHIDEEQTGNNPVCGDQMHISAKFSGDKITDVSVNGSGCAISIASGSMLAELLPGLTIEKAEELGETFKKMMHGEEPPDDVDIGDLDALEGVRNFPVRIKCALLAWDTLQKIIKNHRNHTGNLTETTIKEAL